MSGVDVSSEAIMNAQRACMSSIDVLKRSIEKLRQSIAECGWKDDKFKQLHDIVQGCAIQLNAPINDLNNGVKKLDDIYKAIKEYEDTSL